MRRAPYVDVVFGPQTLHRLPAADPRRAARPARRRSTSRFPTIEKFDHLPPPRVDGASAFVSIMEGCSKYCTFCVVPYTRGEEVSRPFDDVLTEVADLADQGVRGGHAARPERQRVSRADGRARGEIADLATLLEYIAEIPGHRAHPLHDVAPEGDDAAAHRRLRQRRQARLAPAPARAVGLRPRARGDEARLHGARIQVDRAEAARARARTSRSRPISSSASPARPTPISTQTMQLVEDVDFDGAFSFAYSPRPGTPAAELADQVPAAVQQARLERLQALLDAQYRAYSEAMVGTRQRVLVTGRAARDERELAARTDNNRVVNFAGDATLDRRATPTSRSPPRCAHSLRGELAAAPSSARDEPWRGAHGLLADSRLPSTRPPMHRTPSPTNFALPLGAFARSPRSRSRLSAAPACAARGQRRGRAVAPRRPPPSPTRRPPLPRARPRAAPRARARALAGAAPRRRGRGRRRRGRATEAVRGSDQGREGDRRASSALWQKDEKVWIEIAPDQFGVPFLFTANLSRGVGEQGVYGGMMLVDQIVEWKRIGNTVQLIAKNYAFTGGSQRADRAGRQGRLHRQPARRRRPSRASRTRSARRC